MFAEKHEIQAPAILYLIKQNERKIRCEILKMKFDFVSNFEEQHFLQDNRHRFLMEL